MSEGLGVVDEEEEEEEMRRLMDDTYQDSISQTTMTYRYHKEMERKKEVVC